MCGLASILLFPMERSEAEWSAIRHCFTQTLLCNEEQSREASGLALVRRDGSLQLLKQPVSASELVASDAYQELLAQTDAETTCLLGHTRAPSGGSRWDNANNHPLIAGQVVGIHSGHIQNGDLLFAEWALPRRGQTDSEVVFRLLDTISPFSQNGGYLAAVRRRVALLQGQFATLSVDLWRPSRLLVLKYDMPLSVHYHQPWQALCFSSRDLSLRKAFGPSVVAEALPAQRAYLFDAEQLPERGKEPMDSLALTLSQAMESRPGATYPGP